MSYSDPPRIYLFFFPDLPFLTAFHHDAFFFQFYHFNFPTDLYFFVPVISKIVLYDFRLFFLPPIFSSLFFPLLCFPPPNHNFSGKNLVKALSVYHPPPPQFFREKLGKRFIGLSSIYSQYTNSNLPNCVCRKKSRLQ